MEDLTGQRFGRLLVEGFSHVEGRKPFWECLCDCGNHVAVSSHHLRSGHTKSCGCISKERKEDLTGVRYGRLTVLEFSHMANRKSYWKCLCDCGNTTIVRGDQIKDGNTKSCGCYSRDRSLLPPVEYSEEKAIKKAKSTLRSIQRRCSDTKHYRFKDYGGRGITVCDRWLGVSGFANFLEDIKLPPTMKHQVDRINNDGNYEPTNCRWATNQENSWNKQSDFDITYKGETKPLGIWVGELGLDFSTVKGRIQFGWDVEKAFNTPLPVGRRSK